MTTLTPAAPDVAESAGRRQPRALYLLFATEAWERFGYYGMRAILMLAMVKAIGFPETQAAVIYGFYTGFVYLTPLAGGLLADRVLGYRRAILLGGATMAAGEFCLAAGSLAAFYVGLGLLLVGNGLFKPNISTLVGTLYEEGDPRRDRAFTIFYMGINLGALLSPIVCGQLLGENPAFGFRWGFGAAGIGMVVAVVTFALFAEPALGDRGRAPVRASAKATEGASGMGPAVEKARPLTAIERGRIAALFVVVGFVVFFWMAFEQAGSTMTLFADQSTDRNVFGFEARASLFQAVNPVFILLLAPAVSSLWAALSRAGREPSTPLKMVLGLAFLGVGFIPMVAASNAAAAFGRASWVYLVLAYFFHTLGELCLSPIGLSLVTKLAPKKYASLMMGTWFLANVVGNFLVGLTGALYDRISHAQFFTLFLASSFAAALVLFFLQRPLRGLMAGVH